MIHEEGTFAGLHGVPIYHQRWLPAGDARAAVLLVHGYAEHSGRYGNLIDAVVPLGYAVYTLDHRGHGRSGGERVHVDSFDDYVADLRTCDEAFRAEHPGLRIYLLGHSMGSFIASLYAARYQDDLGGLILSGSVSSNRPKPAASQAPIDLAATVSRDPAVVQAYRDDPLVYHGQPPESRAAAVQALREALPAAVAGITLPVLIIAGEASPLGDGPGSRALFETVPSEDKTLKLYGGLFHEIFNEPERDQVFADLVAWFEDHEQGHTSAANER